MKKIFSIFLAFAIFALQACGTLLKSDQVGRAHSKKLDTTIVILDAIGLLFFLVPGIVAFAVDYYNGTLFLPRGVAVKIDNMNAKEIQQVLADNGYSVSVEEVEKAMVAGGASL